MMPVLRLIVATLGLSLVYVITPELAEVGAVFVGAVCPKITEFELNVKPLITGVAGVTVNEVVADASP
jgi:hypothetical protein